MTNYMTRKSGTHRQQYTFHCEYCPYTTNRNSKYILHMKDVHGKEL